MSRKTAWTVAAGLVILAGIYAQRSPGPAASQNPAAAGQVLQLSFGLSNEAPALYEVEIRLSAGRILSAEGLHFTGGDQIISPSQYRFQTRVYQDMRDRYDRRPADHLPNNVRILPNGVFVTIDAPASAVCTIQTNKGDVAITLAELEARGSLSMFHGDAAAALGPAVAPLTRGASTHHDFPAAAALGEDLFVAWTAYQNDANLIYLAHRRGGVWSTQQASARWGDYHSSAIARLNGDRILLVWSSYQSSRWRLVSRVFEPASNRWSGEQFVAAAGTRQLFPRMTSGADGVPWLVWQEFGGGNYEVLAARYDSKGWSVPLNLSQSPASDWLPSVAAGPAGDVSVVWDSYRDGDYNIFLRRIKNGVPGPLIQVTRAETYDANATVAVDSTGLVWIAWEESGANWGKDTGLLGSPGTELHDGRRVRLVAWDGKGFFEPSTPLEKAVPAWLGSWHEYPQLATGPDGLPYLTFRHFLHRYPMADREIELRTGDVARRLPGWAHDSFRQLWDVFVIGFDGKNWSAAWQLPQSTGRCHMYTAAAHVSGRLAIVWPTDGRTYTTPVLKSSELRLTELRPRRAAGGLEMKPFVSERTGIRNAAPTEQQDRRRVRAVRWQASTPLRLVLGDLHRHTDISIDSGSLDGDILTQYRYAIDAGGLDFVAITDHSTHELLPYYQYDWHRTMQIATMFDNPGHFVSFFAYERTVPPPGGHRNVISARRDLKPVPVPDGELIGIESYAARLYPSLRARGEIAIAHTPGTDWRDGDTSVEPLVEIFQSHRGSYEAADSPASARKRADIGDVRNAWAKGYQLGVIASSDHQESHQSFACVYARELTREAILESMKRRLTYAATDAIVLKFEATAADGRRRLMGGSFAGAPKSFHIEVAGTAPIDWLHMIRDGRVIHAWKPGAAQSVLSFRDNAVSNSERHYYYLRLQQANGQLAWSSPIWTGSR